MICISDTELLAVFTEWEDDTRKGDCLTHAESDAMTPEDRVKARAETFKRLAAKHAAKQTP